MTIDELRDELGTRPSTSGYRCSDNGFLNMSVEDYLGASRLDRSATGRW
ncbi:MAG: hypothetical protein R3C56_13515 [Pirellulaceae bacterium]